METVAKWVPAGIKLLIAMTTAVPARLTRAPPCISPAPCANSIKKGHTQHSPAFASLFDSHVQQPFKRCAADPVVHVKLMGSCGFSCWVVFAVMHVVDSHPSFHMLRDKKTGLLLPALYYTASGRSISLAQPLLSGSWAFQPCRSPQSFTPVLIEVRPPTGEPDAGNPPVRFGGRGGDEPFLPLSGW